MCICDTTDPDRSSNFKSKLTTRHDQHQARIHRASRRGVMAPSTVNHLVVSCLLDSTLALPLAQMQRRGLNTTAQDGALEKRQVATSLGYDFPAVTYASPYATAQDLPTVVYVTTLTSTNYGLPTPSGTAGHARRQDTPGRTDGSDFAYLPSAASAEASAAPSQSSALSYASSLDELPGRADPTATASYAKRQDTPTQIEAPMPSYADTEMQAPAATSYEWSADGVALQNEEPTATMPGVAEPMLRARQTENSVDSLSGSESEGMNDVASESISGSELVSGSSSDSVSDTSSSSSSNGISSENSDEPNLKTRQEPEASSPGGGDNMVPSSNEADVNGGSASPGGGSDTPEAASEDMGTGSDDTSPGPSGSK